MTEVERFNKFHGAAGSGHGGQFVSSAESGGAKKAQAPKGPAPRTAAAQHASVQQARERAARAERLRYQAKAYRERARKLEAELHALEAQHHANVVSAKKAAQSAKHKAINPHAKHQNPGHKGQHHGQQHQHAGKPGHGGGSGGSGKSAPSLTARITHLKQEIHSLRESADKADAQAAALAPVSRTAQTYEASTVHKPLGKPGGPGLFHHKGLQLPAYIQSVAQHLVASHGESKAIEMAVGIVKNWAAGHDGHGNKVHADVQAAAAKAVAQWEADKARGSKVRRAAVADNKPYGNVRYADPKNGKYPIDTEAHCRAAWAYINMPKNAAMYPLNGVTLSEVKDRIRAALKKYGADVSSDSKDSGMSRAGSWRELVRPFVVDDLHIMRAADGEPSGRVVEGYCAVFGQQAEIHDRQGDYYESIDPHAFDATLARAAQRKGGIGAAVRVLFNHGKTIEGHPAPEFQKPIGRALSVTPDSRGLLTRTELNRTAHAEEVLELIRSGSITGMSFQGADLRSDPPLRGPGDRYGTRGKGVLPTVRRMALSLFEYSPVVFEAYPGAEFLGVVRMGSLDTYTDDDFVPATDGGLTDYEEPPPDEDGAGDPAEDGVLARHHQHALYALRSQEMRAHEGLNF